MADNEQYNIGNMESGDSDNASSTSTDSQMGPGNNATNTKSSATATTKPSSTAQANRATASALIIAAGDKAGMDGIDRSRIDHIILRESAGTRYLEQQQRRDDKVNERIAGMKSKLEQMQSQPGYATTLHQKLAEMDGMAQELLKDRKTRSTCVVCEYLY